jgi:hypothetical protein
LFSVCNDFYSVIDAQPGPETTLADWIQSFVSHREQQGDVAPTLTTAE